MPALPFDILHAIVAQLALDRTTLNKLALCAPIFANLAQPWLFHSVVRTVQSAEGWANTVVQFIVQHACLAKHIHGFTLRGPPAFRIYANFVSHVTLDLEALQPVWPLLTSLDKLSFVRFATPTAIPQSPLVNRLISISLRYITILQHSVSLSDIINLFPNLNNVELSAIACYREPDPQSTSAPSMSTANLKANCLSVSLRHSNNTPQDLGSQYPRFRLKSKLICDNVDQEGLPWVVNTLSMNAQVLTAFTLNVEHITDGVSWMELSRSMLEGLRASESLKYLSVRIPYHSPTRNEQWTPHTWFAAECVKYIPRACSTLRLEFSFRSWLSSDLGLFTIPWATLFENVQGEAQLNTVMLVVMTSVLGRQLQWDAENIRGANAAFEREGREVLFEDDVGHWLG